MGVFIDIVIILVILGCIYGGYKRGLARCLLKILTSILAIIIALVLYKPFVNFIIDNTTIDDQIELSIENIIKQNSKEDDSNEKIINEDNVMPKPITNYINNNVKNSVDEKKDEAITEASKNASKLILTIFTDIVSKLPIIKQCNQLGGIIYGILEAFVILLIIFAIISAVTPLIGNYTISNAILESHIGKILYNNNIILNLIF